MLVWACTPLPEVSHKDYIPVQGTVSECLASDADRMRWSTYLLGSESGTSPCSSDLSDAIGRVRDLRNPPSHIDLMREVSFNELRGIILDNGHLSNVLQLVRSMNVPATVIPYSGFFTEWASEERQGAPGPRPGRQSLAQCHGTPL